MNLASLQAEVLARGFDYLGQDAAGLARVTRWINDAYRFDICDAEPWPFLEATASGPAPLGVADLKDVLAVVDVDQDRRLTHIDRREAIDLDPTLDDAGAPHSYYLVDQTVAVWPVSAASLTVHYIRVPPALSGAGDTPLVPERFHGLIVDAAVVRAYRDSDNWEAAAIARSEFEAAMARMTDAMFSRNLDDAQYIVRTDYHDG